MPTNGTQTTTPDAVGRAIEASRRLLDAATKARSACLEACQETVLGLPGVEATLAAVRPADWSAFAPQLGFGEALDADELLAAGKRICLECVDSYEQAVLAAIDLRERIVEASNLDWLQMIASASIALERDLTEAYAESIRELLK